MKRFLLLLPLIQARNLVTTDLIKEDFNGLIQRQHDKLARISQVQQRQSATNPSADIRRLVERAGSPSSSSFPFYEYYYQGVDLGYLIEVEIGTPPQKVYVQFDTGSETFWVNSPQSATGVQTYYDPGKSSTENNTNTPFNITYGKGSAEGTYYQDTVTIGNYTITSRPFGLETVEDEASAGSPLSGIIGMAASNLFPDSIETPFEDLIQQNALSQLLFSVYLPRGTDLGITGLGSRTTLTSGGEVCFGCMAATPSGYTAGSVNWVPVTPFAFWQTVIDGWAVNGKVVSGTSGEGILDTGSSFISLPSVIATALLAPLNGVVTEDGIWSVPVSSIADSTTMGVSIGGVIYDIDLEDLVISYTDNSATYYLVAVLNGDDAADFSGHPLAVLGDTFLKNVISTYSYSHDGSPAIGLQQLTATNSKGDNLTSITGSDAPTGVVPPPVKPSGKSSRTGGRLGGGDVTQTSSGSSAQTSSTTGTSSASSRGVGLAVGGLALSFALGVVVLVA